MGGSMAKTGRNQPCACGSGRKTKRCCGTSAGPHRSSKLVLGCARRPDGGRTSSPATTTSSRGWRMRSSTCRDATCRCTCRCRGCCRRHWNGSGPPLRPGTRTPPST
ncbi:MAG: SEC-C metal-binding domain-containing protein, partial [Egibacteraceae bacterium]